MKVGLDTSVVLRLLTGEPAPQARHALAEVQSLIQSDAVLLISDLVTAEVYFALQYHYRIPKKEALSILAGLFADKHVESLGAAANVLAMPRLHTARPGFVDRLIHAEYALSTNEMLTFEHAGARLPGVRVLPGE